MIIVDNALRAREAAGGPIRVGMVGAGFMAQGLANQIANSVPGMVMAAIYNRRPQRAVDVYATPARARRSWPTTRERSRTRSARGGRR